MHKDDVAFEQDYHRHMLPLIQDAAKKGKTEEWIRIWGAFDYVPREEIPERFRKLQVMCALRFKKDNYKTRCQYDYYPTEDGSYFTYLNVLVLLPNPPRSK